MYLLGSLEGIERRSLVRGAFGAEYGEAVANPSSRKRARGEADSKIVRKQEYLSPRNEAT
jgi:hypothetical protein